MRPFFRSLCLSLTTLTCILLITDASLFASPKAANPHPAGRFFLMGSGSMHLKNWRNHREAKVNLLNQNGSFNEEAFSKVDWVFDFPAQEKGEHISPRLLFMLSYFADHLAPGKTINIESAYRSPEYNEHIREQGNNAARTSLHQDGMALDFWLQGVQGKRIWDVVKEKNCAGIGYYGGKAVHLDAGRPRFWQSATSGTQSKEPDYNRHLYLSTDFDRYKTKDRVRLAFTGLSSFDFGVHPTAQVFRADNLKTPVTTLRLERGGETDCVHIGNRKSSRLLAASLPPYLPPGRYTIKVEFCEKPFEQMSSEAMSNTIELMP